MKKRAGMSLTESVASTLEKEIFKGIFPPNSPLPSTRILAERFQVSQRVILGALDMLEKKDILLRQERKKVFVKAREAVSGAKEILFFAFGDELGGHIIYRTIQEMILASSRKRKYDFFSRLVSSSDAMTNSRLEREVARLQNLGFIDCAIFYGGFSADEMRLCQTLPYPVIFLGERSGNAPLPPGTRIVSPNSADLLLTGARYALEKKASRFTLLYWEKPASTAYLKAAYKELDSFLKANHLPLEFIPIAGKSLEEARSKFEKEAKEIASGLPPGTLFVAQNIHSEKFLKGELLPPNEFPFIRFLSLDAPLIKEKNIPYVSRSSSELQKAVMEEIEGISTLSSHQTSHKIVDLHYKVIEN